MLKKLTFFALCLAMMALSSCKKDDPPKSIDPPFVTTEQLTHAYGIISSIASENAGTVQLVISNLQGDLMEDFTGSGQYVSLLLSSSKVSVVDGKVQLATGIYSMPTTVGSELVIQNTSDSYFCEMDAAGTKKTHAISAGNVTISSTPDEYTISGELRGADRSAFKFEFTGVIGVIPEDTEKVMTDADVRYDNKFIKNEKFVYTITLINTTGQQISLEIVTALSNYFTEIPSATYTFSASKTDAGVILKSDDSFFTIMASGMKYPIDKGEITLTKIDSDYKIEGAVSSAGNRGVEFSFDGVLPVTKASLYFKDGELMIDGQSYGLNYCDYVLYSWPNDLEGVGERIMAFMTGPVDLYYRYLPMATGSYSVFGGDIPLAPFMVSSNLEWSDTGFKFYDADGTDTLYGLTGGVIDITSSVLNGTKYTFALSGQLASENEAGDKLDVDLTWEGTLDNRIDYAGYWNGFMTHPWTTLTADLAKNNFTSAVYEYRGTSYWQQETGITDRGYVQICCMTEGGEYEEWFYAPEDTDPNHYYLLIGLNLAGELPADGIPVGTYKMDKDWTFAPETFMPGTAVGYSNNYAGSMIINAPYTFVAPFGCGSNDDGGEIKIAKAGDIYTITVNCFDDAGFGKAHKITASYVGAITDVDDMKSGVPQVFNRSFPNEKRLKDISGKRMKRENYVEK